MKISDQATAKNDTISDAMINEKSQRQTVQDSTSLASTAYVDQ